jgi:hypothetical protein
VRFKFCSGDSGEGAENEEENEEEDSEEEEGLFKAKSDK